MGWQGRFRDAKGRRLFSRMLDGRSGKYGDPGRFRDAKFVEAWAWRDDGYAHLTFEQDGATYRARINRQTGEITHIRQMED